MRIEMKEKINEPIYTLTGIVIHGRGIGKHVGTPTANIEIAKNTFLPKTGVYVADILLSGKIYYGVTHIGTRPTLDNDSFVSIETHIFDFDKDIYGCTITVNLYKKLREVRKFNELSLLLEQITNDRTMAQEFWGLKQTNHTLHIDISRHCVILEQQEVYLSTNEFEVLYLLLQSPQTTFTKEQIYEQIWHEPTNNHLHAVENTIFQIRKGFNATEISNYKEEKIGLNWILVKVSEKDDSLRTATVYARNTGLFEDSYHVYFYSDEIKKLAEPLCKDKNYIQKYDIEIEGRPTSTEWTGKESIEEYIEKAEYTVVLKIHLQDGKAESEYAEEISDLMQEIMQCDLNIHILVYVNGENPIFYSLPEEDRQSDVDFILKEMYNIKSLQESIEHADEWKKQNQNNAKDYE